MNLFELAAKITLDTSEYDKGLSSAGQAIKSFAGGIAKVTTAMAAAGAAVIGGLISMTGKTAEYGDTVDKMSQKMGMTAEAYQEWDFVMQHCGTSMETLKASMKTLSNAAETGNEAFRQLGISQEEVAQLDQQQLFERTIAALQNVEDTTERTYLAGKLLGRGATELGALLNMSAEETAAMRQEIHDLGGVMSDEAVKAAANYKDKVQNLQTAFTGLRTRLTADFMPALSNIMDGLAKLFSGRGGLEQIQQGIEEFAAGIREKMPKVIAVASGLIETFTEVIIDGLPTLIELGTDMIVAIINGIVKNIPKLVDAAGKIGKTLIENIGKAIPKIVSGLKTLWNSLGTATKAILAAVVAIKSFKTAVAIIGAVRTAFLALHNPVVLATAAIGALAGGFVVLASALSESNNAAYKFSEAETEIIEKGEEAQKTIADMREARDKNIAAIDAETKKTQDLWAELQALADENGNVKEADQDRARYILGELNEALGTEYDMNDGLIGQYQQMQNEIDTLIQKRRAEQLLVEAHDVLEQYGDIKDAVENEVKVQQDALVAEQDVYERRIKALTDFLRENEDVFARYATSADFNIGDLANLFSEGSVYQYQDVLDLTAMRENAELLFVDWQDLVNKQQESAAAVAKTSDNYIRATRIAESYYEEVADAEDAERLIMEGRYEEAAALIDKDSAARWRALAERGQILEADQSQLRDSYERAIWYFNWYKDRVKEGRRGFDAVGVREAAAKAKELIELWNEISGEAVKVGEDIVAGLVYGMRSSMNSVAATAGEVAATALKQMRAVAQIESPSKVTRSFGRFIDEGLALGMTDELNTVRNAAERVADYAIPPIGTVGAGGVGSAYSDRSTSIGSIVLNVNGSNVSNVERLADLVADRINRDVLRKVAAT